jgi:hypothetical protein
MNAQELMTQFAGMQAGGAPMLGGSQGGALGDAQELQKALTASNYQTDVSTLTGGGALGIQSLDTAMKTVIQEEQHFVLFKKLQQSNATNIVDEYTRQNSIGGILGGSTNSQMGVVRASQGDYSREVGMVKFLMTMRQVGYVLNLGKNLAEPMAVEERNGALQLLTDAEYLLFHGNASACPTQYDGIFKQIDDAITQGQVSSDHVIDLQGTALTSIEPFTKLQAAVQDYGNWGRITETYLPTAVQTDLNMGLDPAFRWNAQPNSVSTIGAHVEGIRLTEGVLKTNIDTFIHHGDFPMAKPIEVTWPATAMANTAMKPAALAAVMAAGVDSQFTAPRAGNYFYAVSGIGGDGEGMSDIRISAQFAVAAGNKVTLTISQSAGQRETGYAVYRSKQNGAGAVASDFRLVKVIPKTGASTVFVDINRDIPGTVSVPCLNMNSGSDAIGWRQFQPMTKIPLPFGIGGVPVNSWFQFLFGYLRMTKPKHHGYIKNILPNNAVWRPHV